MEGVEKDIVIVLGAGASSSDGCPLQSDLIRDYFELIKNGRIDFSQQHHLDYRDVLSDFFKLTSGFDYAVDDHQKFTFPTFEECLAIASLADASTGTPPSPSRYDALIYLIAKVLQEILFGKNKIDDDHFARHHRMLVHQLRECGVLDRTIFVDINYDTLLDTACEKEGFQTYYGKNLEELEWFRSDDTSHDRPVVHVLKPNGSINWLWCRDCKKLRMMKDHNAMMGGLLKVLFDDDCKQPFSPAITPPSYSKDVNLARLMEGIDREIASAFEHASVVFFCGYSFPEADFHIKAWMKAGETRRATPIPAMYLVTHHDRKTDAQAAAEFDRYSRFFNRDAHIIQTGVDFQTFISRLGFFMADHL